MKASVHLINQLDPAITREKGIEGPAERGTGPTDWSAEADSLTYCVHPGIGPSGGMSNGPATKETLQNPLEFALNRASGGLALPPDKAGAVIV
jgi:hypothetical protein